MQVAVDAVAFRRTEQPPHATVYARVTVPGFPSSIDTDRGPMEAMPNLGYTFAIRQRLTLPAPLERGDSPVSLTIQLCCGVSGVCLLEVRVAVSKQWTVAPPPYKGEVYVSYYCSYGATGRPLRPPSAIIARRGALARLPATQPSSGVEKLLVIAGGDRGAAGMAFGKRVTLTVKKVEGLALETKRPVELRVAVAFSRRVRHTPSVLSHPIGLVHSADFSSYAVVLFIPSSNLTPFLQIAIEHAASDPRATVGTVRVPITEGDGMSPVYGHQDSLLGYSVRITESWQENDDTSAAAPVREAESTTGDGAMIHASQLEDEVHEGSPAAAGTMIAESRSVTTTAATVVGEPIFPVPLFIAGVNITATVSSAVTGALEAASARIVSSLESLERRVASLERSGIPPVLRRTRELQCSYPSFQRLDRDGRGYISAASMRSALRCTDPFHSVMSDAELDREISDVVPCELLRQDLVSEHDYETLMLRATQA